MENNWTVAKQIVEIMKREQIDRVFSVPGESFLDLMDEIYKDGSIDFVAARHEGGASFMAEAYGKASKKPGVAAATRGVGASNLAIGVHTAYQDSTPMVVFLGQVERQFRGREGFQEIELEQMFAPMTKWTYELTDPGRTNEMVSRAFRIAQSGRPGPVVISLPADLLGEKSAYKELPGYQVSRPFPEVNEINQAVELLQTAKRPLIVAGGGVLLSDAEALLQRFAEKTNIPVLASFRRHDVIPNNHEQYVGHSGLGTLPAILDTARQADVVLAIGTRFSEITTQSYSLFSEQMTLLHIDIDPDTLGKVYPPDVGVTADAAKALTALLESTVQPKTEWKEWAKQRRNAYLEVTAIPDRPHPDTVDMQQIIRNMQNILPEDAIITNDAGNFSAWLHNYYQFHNAHTYIGPTSGAMGYGLPAAIAAKLARPEQTVVSLSGDGGFMMTVQELETAKRENVPVIALVFNNSMYGTIRMHQEKQFPGHVIGTSLADIDFTGLAEAIGIRSERIKDDASFADALKRAMEQKEPAVIEVICDPEKISVLSDLSDFHK